MRVWMDDGIVYHMLCVCMDGIVYHIFCVYGWYSISYVIQFNSILFRERERERAQLHQYTNKHEDDDDSSNDGGQQAATTVTVAMILLNNNY